VSVEEEARSVCVVEKEKVSRAPGEAWAHQVWRVSAVRVEGDKDSCGRKRPGTRPRGLVVVGGAAKEAKTEGIVGQ
jgi:hypothetical protein